MDIFTDLTTRVVALRDRLGEVARTEDLPAAVAALDDAAIVEIITAVSGLTRTIEQIGLAATGVASARSTRAAGHSGLAQSLGHRSPVALIQHATGDPRRSPAPGARRRVAARGVRPRRRARLGCRGRGFR
ncbi:hypothetical protein NHL51_03590 [Leucobacter sp. gxy201]|uniref:hypothetical protein n=1 Tax=Leucobacter sp. gxy201 TaxID=2957200 RepID=UPI003DA0EE9E